MIGLINYEAGNIRSVENALERLGQKFFISDDIEKLKKADKIIFPGVGNAEMAMKNLQKKSLDIFLKNCQKPVLGICLGMQIFFEFSEEGSTPCLNIFPGKINKFDDKKCPQIPHMGWNDIEINKKNNFLTSDFDKKFFYFVHSFFVPVCKYTIATCFYGEKFSAAVNKDNFFGVQFHPEKSGDIGEKLLENFLKI